MQPRCVLFRKAAPTISLNERAVDARRTVEKGFEVSTATSSSVITVAIHFPDISRAM